jgi:putative transposase
VNKRKRRKAIEASFQAHALNFSTYRRQPFVLTPGVPEIFFRHLEEARRTLEFDVWAFVLMPDHVHLVLWPRRETYSMAAILKAIKAQAAKEILDAFPKIEARCQVLLANGKTERRFWQPGGGYDRNLYSSKAAWSEIGYVHRNPVERGLCERPRHWPYSSVRAYLDEPEATPVPVDLCPWDVDY